MGTWRPRQRYETVQGAVAWGCFGEGPPVVLLHGTPFSSFVWRDLAPALTVDHQVYVWDMLGYGMSDQRPDQDVSLRAQAVLFAELVAEWGIHRPAVVAHDFGAPSPHAPTCFTESTSNDSPWWTLWHPDEVQDRYRS